MLVRLISLTIATVESNTLLSVIGLMQATAFWLCDRDIKKALNLSAFFMSLVFISILFADPALAKNCTSSMLTPPEKAVVKWVYDGDTLLLRDKRKIRVIGIDTPEVRHYQQKAQAYGAKAKEALRELLKRFHYQVLLRYGSERKDRYSRVLAHVYLPDGTNISNWLLERGFAKTMAFPPNIKLAKCYKKSEEVAQKQSLKLWHYKNNQIKTIASLSQRATGYIRLKAVIKKIKHHKKSWVAILKGNDKRPIRIKIKKKYFKYFKSIKLNKLVNKMIVVTGMLKNRSGKRTIYVSYPTQFTILPRGSKIKGTGKATVQWSSKK